jgi:hypothetical protein
MKRTKDYNGYLEVDFAIKLAQLEGCMKFLHYMNFDDDGNVIERPRNETERQSIVNNLKRVQELRDMYKTINHKLNQHS